MTLNYIKQQYIINPNPNKPIPNQSTEQTLQTKPTRIASIITTNHQLSLQVLIKPISAMSTLKYSLSPKSLFSIKIPNNMTDSQLQNAVVGGLLFAAAACLYYVVFGKLIGRTSLIKLIGSLQSKTNSAIFATVLAGVVFSSALVKELYHQHYIDFEPYDTKAYVRKTEEAVLIVAGFLVGFGSALAGGCTVGHGVTGLARTKRASLFAVILFCTTAYLANRYKLAEAIPQQFSDYVKFRLPNNISSDIYVNACMAVPFIFFVLFKDKSLKGLVKYILNFSIGILFGIAMMIGGLAQRQLVLEAINFTPKYWNPTILVFFAVAMVACGIVMAIIRRKQITPVFSSVTQNPPQAISMKLILGSIIFGLGWGLGGLCTASFYVMIPLTSLKIPVYWGISCFLGFKIAELIQKILQRIGKKSSNSSKIVSN